MTQIDVSALPATTVPVWVSRAGAMCLAAGILGAASGIFLAVYPAQVSEDMFSYPLTAGGFTVIQIWFVVQHMGLLAGIAALARAAVMARGRGARWGSVLATSGMALVAGIFVFVPMMPALMGPFVLARASITVWMLLFAALGYALWKKTDG